MTQGGATLTVRGPTVRQGVPANPGIWNASVTETYRFVSLSLCQALPAAYSKPKNAFHAPTSASGTANTSTLLALVMPT